MTILASVMQFTALPLQGLSQGAQPIIGFNYGAGNPDRVKEAFRLLLACCMIFAGGLWLLVMVFPQVFIGIFTSDPTLVRFTRWALRVYMAVSSCTGSSWPASRPSSPWATPRPRCSWRCCARSSC